MEDLGDTLHEIASQRKEDAAREREICMNDGWVPDHLGLLTNHYITLMQVSERVTLLHPEVSSLSRARVKSIDIRMPCVYSAITTNRCNNRFPMR